MYEIFQSVSSQSWEFPRHAKDGRNVGCILHISEGAELLALHHHAVHARLPTAQLEVQAEVLQESEMFYPGLRAS